MILILALIAFAWAVVIAHVRPTWIVCIALAVFTFETVFGSSSGLNVGGALMYPRDVAFAAMAVAGVLRIVAAPSVLRREDRAWYWIAALALISFGRGVQAFGTNAAGNDFRSVFYVVAALLFIAMQPTGSRLVRNIVDLWIGVGILLLGVGLLRAMGLGVGAAAEQQLLSGGRALYAAPTFLILQAALMSFFAEQLGSRWVKIPGLPWLLLSGVLIFRHRTVWAAMAVCLFAMWTVLKAKCVKRDKRFTRRLGGVAVAVTLVVLFAAGGKIEAIQRSLVKSTESTTAKHSTFSWRLEGWRYLISQQRTKAADLIIGKPFGSGYRRMVSGGVVDVSPHSWYVQTIGRLGLVGLFFLLRAMVGLFRRGRDASLLPGKLGALLVLSVVVFGVAYEPSEIQGILLGLVTLAWCRDEKEAQPALDRRASTLYLTGERDIAASVSN